jgi:hypothetical protein
MDTLLHLIGKFYMNVARIHALYSLSCESLITSSEDSFRDSAF